eukprot:tig00000144_g9068.t2
MLAATRTVNMSPSWAPRTTAKRRVLRDLSPGGPVESEPVEGEPLVPSAPCCPSPNTGVPPPRDGKTFTLVLDLDETLIHSEWSVTQGWKTLRRPGMQLFLRSMSQIADLILFTAGTQEYAMPIIDRFVDPHNEFFTARLFREWTTQVGMNHVKDLSKLNRDLSRTVIVDNLSESFALHPLNGIQIRPFISDMRDTALIQLIPFMQKLIGDNVDVREALKTMPIPPAVGPGVVISARTPVWRKSTTGKAWTPKATAAPLSATTTLGGPSKVAGLGAAKAVGTSPTSVSVAVSSIADLDTNVAASNSYATPLRRRPGAAHNENAGRAANALTQSTPTSLSATMARASSVGRRRPRVG